MDQTEHEEWNERMAKLYDPDTFINKSGSIIRWVEANRLKKTRQALKVEPHHDVLDLGCGSGNLLSILKATKIVGVDISDALLEKARERLARRSDIQVMKANAQQLPFPEKTFDRIVCSEVMEHVLDPVGVLQEIHRICKPGARIVVTVPNEALINFSKRIVIALGLKKWVAGDYRMSDNMLDEWHRSELTAENLMEMTKGLFRFVAQQAAPSRLIPYHRIFIFESNP